MATDTEARQEILDEEHLRLLSLFHYVRAGTTAFFVCIRRENALLKRSNCDSFTDMDALIGATFALTATTDEVYDEL